MTPQATANNIAPTIDGPKIIYKIAPAMKVSTAENVLRSTTLPKDSFSPFFFDIMALSHD
jgi:hypothetical protein